MRCPLVVAFENCVSVKSTLRFLMKNNGQDESSLTGSLPLVNLRFAGTTEKEK